MLDSSSDVTSIIDITGVHPIDVEAVMRISERAHWVGEYIQQLG